MDTLYSNPTRMMFEKALKRIKNGHRSFRHMLIIDLWTMIDDSLGGNPQKARKQTCSRFDAECIFHCLMVYPCPGAFIETVHYQGFDPRGTFFEDEEKSLGFFQRHWQRILHKRGIKPNSELSDKEKVYLTRLTFEHWLLGVYRKALASYAPYKEYIRPPHAPGEKYKKDRDMREISIELPDIFQD